MAQGKANQVFPALQADDAFICTLSDTVNVGDDPANLKGYNQVLPKNNTASDGFIKITTSHDTDITIYVKSGMVEPIAAKRIWLNGTTVTQVAGYVGHQKV